MHIVAMVQNTSSKKTIKNFCLTHHHSVEFVHNTLDLLESLDSEPHYLILEAHFDELDYEDVLIELPSTQSSKAYKRILINNTPDLLQNMPTIDAIIDEYALAQQLPTLFQTSIGSTRRILYASDDKFMHRVIGDLLKMNHFDVIQALDGNEAYALYNSHNPDLVLTDLDMPGMSGLELCRQIKVVDNNRTTPVVILSGSQFESDIEAAFNCQAKAYLVKPISPEKLIKKINQLLPSSQ